MLIQENYGDQCNLKDRIAWGDGQTMNKIWEPLISMRLFAIEALKYLANINGSGTKDEESTSNSINRLPRERENYIAQSYPQRW